MATNDAVERYLQAVLDQLNAEIGANKKYNNNVKALARDVGINYTQFRRYITGERNMPQPVLWSTVLMLGIDQELFVKRATDRWRAA